MDPIAGLLAGPRARGAFVVRSLLAPPFSLAVHDQAPLSLVCVLRGVAWLEAADGSVCELRPGQIALARGPRHYRLVDTVGRAVQVVIEPDQSCHTPDGHLVGPIGSFGVRTWGNDPNGSTEILSGTYLESGEVGRTVLDALPDVARPEPGEWSAPLVQLLADASVRNDPGQQVVLDRILDLLLVAALRAWFDSVDPAPGWYRARHDAAVATAVGLLQAHPGQPWTVERLARAAGLSRAAFARRFTDRVGQAPMAFLTDLRLHLAADLLATPGATLAAVAHQVGYSTPYALSAAFKRERGLSPRAWRQAEGLQVGSTAVA